MNPYETEIVRSFADLPQPPAPNRLAMSGVTVMCYFAHRLAAETGSDWWDRLPLIDDDRSYANKIRSHSGFVYSAAIDAGPVPTALVLAVRGSHASPLRQSLLSLGGDYILSAVPLVISVPRNERVGIEIPNPVRVHDLLAFLALLNDPATAALIAGQTATSAARTLGIDPASIEQTWSLPGSFAMQVWNLDGTTDRDSGRRYEGLRESAEYAWEIAALLSYSSDHLLEGDLWVQRNPQQVFNQVRVGSAFFDDHMVFVTTDCCLEMSHLPAWLRDRSAYRLATYGYDSSSIFVWSAEALKAAVLTDLGRRYRERLSELTAREQLGAVEQSQIASLQVEQVGLLDRITTFGGLLVEPRNRALDEQVSREHSFDRQRSVLLRDMDKVSALSTSLYQVFEESQRSRQETLLAFLALALAAVQIPDFVSQVASLIEGHRWGILGTSVALILAPFLVVGRVLRGRRRGASQRWGR